MQVTVSSEEEKHWRERAENGMLRIVWARYTRVWGGNDEDEPGVISSSSSSSSSGSRNFITVSKPSSSGDNPY